jgi:serine O-acetyltransferase
MRLSLTQDDLTRYVVRQMNGMFPDPDVLIESEVLASVKDALARVDRCFSQIRTKYFYVDGQAAFDHLHSDQYAMFLYMLSRSSFLLGKERLASKAYVLNKALHGLDAYFAVELPEVFQFVHPVGTVLGNARYGNFFTVYQNCTIGSGEDAIYPEFGEGVCLYARSAVIGRCHIGSNVFVGANSFLLNADVESNTTVFGIHPNLTRIPNRGSVRVRKFGMD